jgi:asparagine synthase (glutamine-hydrolysing)
MTIWKDVWALLPGHRLTYSKGRLKIEQYWDARTAVSESPSQIPIEEAKREVRRLLEEAVQIRLMSDVPLGAFLSGGIDSSTIVGLMSQFSDRPVRTFSVGYDVGNDSFDERRYALLAAQHFHTDHQEVIVKGSDILSALDKIIWHMDQPSHDALNSYMVSQAAASGVKVALSGLGGDELFAGYSTFKFTGFLQRFCLLQKITPSIFKRIMAAIDKVLSSRLRAQWPWRVGIGAIGAYTSLVDQFATIRFFYGDSEKVWLFNLEFQRMLNAFSQVQPSLQLLTQLAEGGHEKDIVNQISYLELKTYMSDVLLRDVDVMSMAHSLEVRVPLIDHKLVEFVLGLAGDLKAGGVRDVKWLLKESVKDLLPPEILHRGKKGFAFPMAIWLHEPPFREVVEDCTSKQSVRNRGIFDWRAIEQAKKQFYEHRQFGNSGQIWLRMWIPTVFELWCRSYLDGMNLASRGSL